MIVRNKEQLATLDTLRVIKELGLIKEYTLSSGRMDGINDNIIMLVLNDDTKKLFSCPNYQDIKTKKVKIRNRQVDIDVELAPVIKELNAVGLKTVMCCNGHGKEPSYITFDMGNIVEANCHDMFSNSVGNDKRFTIKWEPVSL